MEQYLALGNKIFKYGNTRGDRTGTGTRSLFGQQMRFNLAEGFPLVTTKPVHLKSIIIELLWFLAGSTNNNLMKEQGVNIWNEWALVDRTPLTLRQRHRLLLEAKQREGVEGYGSIVEHADGSIGINIKGSVQDLETVLDLEKIPKERVGPKDGELGPVYGKMWRSWPSRVMTTNLNDDGTEPLEFQENGWGFPLPNEGVYVETIDQIKELIDGLKNKPFSRRHIVSGWNPAFLPDETKSHEENVSNGRQALPPCHTLFQFYVENRTLGELRSALGEHFWRDMFAELKLDDRPRLEEDVSARTAIFNYIEAKGVPMRKLSCQLYQR